MSTAQDDVGAVTTVLAAPEDGFRILASALPHACCYLDKDLIVEFANTELAELVGTTPERLVGAQLGDVLGAAGRDELAAALERALEGHKVVHECTTEQRATGTRHVRLACKPVLDGTGLATGIVVEAIDVTELRRHEQEARKNEARFRLLAQGVPNQLLLLDRDLRIEFANDVFLQQSGWSAETAHGRHISEVTGTDRYESRLEHYERALAGETVEYESAGAAGSRSGYFRFSYRPSFDEHGEVQGLLSMATDISARRRAEVELEAKQAELLRSNKDLEQFAYVASHDLKAPLRAIEVLVSWIKEELEGHDIGDVQENLGLLARRTQRLSRLLDDLLAYSRAGRKIGKYRLTDCESLVRDTIQLVNAPETVSIEVSDELPTFETYPAPLEQVLRNLIGNAVKHHPGPDGNVTVSCTEREDRYVFAVQDDGPGIDEQYAGRVFEMFQTLRPRDTVEGSGMGLAIVNRIVQWQGGRVWFEPNPAGSGTVFKFEWLKKAPEAAEE